MAYQNQNRAYLPAVRQLFCATRISTNQRVASRARLMYFGSDSCVPEYVHLYLALFNKYYIFYIY